LRGREANQGEGLLEDEGPPRRIIQEGRGEMGEKLLKKRRDGEK
jgi:hypothetical protein